MKRLISYSIIIIFSFHSQRLCSQAIDRKFLGLGEKIFSSGQYLIDREYGLHPIAFEEDQIDTVFIAVHGYRSRGYEWVYALKKMTASKNKTYFYRWDWNQCPNEAGSILYANIEKLLKSNPQIQHINIFGHSYGASIVTEIGDKPDLGSVDIHSIAGALVPMKRLKKRCPDFIGYEGIKLSYRHFQWRTVKQQDGAFKRMDFDPQLVDIFGSSVISLPPVFKDGKRLGHNRSIEWVFNKYFE